MAASRSFRAGVPALASPDFPLPEYELREADGQYELEFPALEIDDDVGDPGARHHQRIALARRDESDYGPFALDVLYARAKAKMWDKTERLKKLPDMQHLRLRHAAAAFVSVAALVRRGVEGRHWRRLHRHQSTCCSPWTPISRHWAPTRMNCRWCSPLLSTERRRRS
jgi:hypothetical protein